MMVHPCTMVPDVCSYTESPTCVTSSSSSCLRRPRERTMAPLAVQEGGEGLRRGSSGAPDRGFASMSEPLRQSDQLVFVATGHYGCCNMPDGCAAAAACRTPVPQPLYRTPRTRASPWHPLRCRCTRAEGSPAMGKRPTTRHSAELHYPTAMPRVPAGKVGNPFIGATCVSIRCIA